MSDYWDEIEKMEEEREAQEYAEAQAYKQGRADGYSQAETDYYKQSEKDREIAYDCGYEKGRANAIEEVKTLIQSRLVDSLCLENATKYGSKNAEQQANSYATVMKYEIADCVDDLLDDLEQLKTEAGGKE